MITIEMSISPVIRVIIYIMVQTEIILYEFIDTIFFNFAPLYIQDRKTYKPAKV